MRYLVAGYRDGKSCIVEHVDCSLASEGKSTQSVAELDLRNLPPRPPGKGELVDSPAPKGCVVSMIILGTPKP